MDWEPLQQDPANKSYLAFLIGQSLARGIRIRVKRWQGGDVTGQVTHQFNDRVAGDGNRIEMRYRLDGGAEFHLSDVVTVERAL